MTRQEFIEEAKRRGKSKEETKAKFEQLEAQGAFDNSSVSQQPAAGPRPDTFGGNMQANQSIEDQPSLTRQIVGGLGALIKGPFVKPASAAMGMATGIAESTPGVQLARSYVLPKIPEGRSPEEVAAENARENKPPWSGLGDIVAHSYRKLLSPPPPPKDPVEEAYRAASEMGSRVVQGMALGGAVQGATGKGLVANLAGGATANIPQLERPIAGGDWGEAGIDMAVNTAIDAALFGVGKVAKIKGLANLTDADVDNAIQKGMSKGVKPTVIGKPSMAKLDKFYDSAKDAVRTIAKNKDVLSLTDEAGEAITHPKNAREFAEAIDQTKKAIYNQYHSMALEAGESGASFDLRPIASEISRISGDLKVPPKVRQYATDVFEELRELDGVSPEIVEARIKDLNSSLGAFYAGRADKAKAQVDASIANALREQLDRQITEATGPGYKELKKQYGALKSIENEVAKRALVNARRANKGLLDFTDIFTGGDLAAGIVTMNPALIMRGAAGRGIKEIFKALNDPDKAIEAMFKAAFRATDEAGGKAIKGSPVVDAINKNKDGGMLGGLKKTLGNERGSIGGDALKGTRFEKLTPAIKSPESGKIYKGWAHKNIFKEQITRQEPGAERAVWQAIFDDNTGKGSPLIGFVDKNGEFISRIDAEREIDKLTEVGAFSLGNEHGSIGGVDNAAAVAFREKQVKSPEFKKWFGDWEKAPEKASKVVDESGKPLVVYHGTNAKGEITEFKPKPKKGNQIAFGNHFTPDSYFANEYATKNGGKVIPVFLDSKKMLDAELFAREGTPEFALAKKLHPRAYVGKDVDGTPMIYVKNAIDATSGARAEKILKDAGYDGLTYDAELRTQTGINTYIKGKKAKTYVVFSPTQIKSATGNSGAYSPTNPNIRVSSPLGMLGLTAAGTGGALTVAGALSRRKAEQDDKPAGKSAIADEFDTSQAFNNLLKSLTKKELEEYAKYENKSAKMATKKK